MGDELDDDLNEIYKKYGYFGVALTLFGTGIFCHILFYQLLGKITGHYLVVLGVVAPIFIIGAGGVIFIVGVYDLIKKII